MAATTVGTSGIQFGITAESGGLVQSFSETSNVQRSEVRNGAGEVVACAIFNPTNSLNWSLTTTGSYATTAGAVLATVANASSVIGKIIVDSVTTNKAADGFVTVDITATRYPNMS